MKTDKWWMSYANQVPEAPPPDIRRTPARAQSKEADVWVPLYQTGITGALVVVGYLTTRAAGALGIGLPVGAFWGVVGLIWLGLLFSNRRLLWAIEERLRVDLDGDRQQGEPPPVEVFVDLSGRNGQQTYQQARLQPPRRSGPAGLWTFARRLANGAGFSEREAGDAGYSRAEWEVLRDEFLGHGWAEWKHPQEPRQGLTLTADGLAVVGELARRGVEREV